MPHFPISPARKEPEPIAILPLGAHEQHGPHLPFETDAIIAQAIAEKVFAASDPDLALHLLPTEQIGYSIEHMDVAGTQSLTYAQAIERWIGIGEKLHHQGIRKFVMLNAHGGNSPLMNIVATELRVRCNMLAVATSWSRFGIPQHLISAEEKSLDIHGGFIETSLMLALRPDLVDMEKAQDFSNAQSEFTEKFDYLRAYGPHAFGWKMSDLNSLGVAGNAARANADAGQEILDHAIRGFSRLLHDINRFDVTTLN